MFKKMFKAKLILLLFVITFASAQSDSVTIPESLLKQVEDGHAESAYFIASQFDKKSLDNEELYEKAKAWMQKSANMGYPQAMYELAQMLDYEELQNKALEWYIKASEFGHADAIYSIATYHMLGIEGKPADCLEAYHWYEKAQKKDNIVSFNDHAWSLATSKDDNCRNSEKALRIFSHVKSYYSLNSEQMPLAYLDTLAAVHAGVADFNKAIEIQQLAVDGMSKDDTYFDAYVERLKSYKNRTAWVQQ